MSIQKIAEYDEKKLAELLADSAIIRHQQKLAALVNNAGRFQEVAAKFGSFYAYIWSFVHVQHVNHWKSIEEIPSSTQLSEQISKDLKSRGFKFLGPITVYSYMQAIGMVNDHIDSCFLKTSH